MANPFRLDIMVFWPDSGRVERVASNNALPSQILTKVINYLSTCILTYPYLLYCGFYLSSVRLYSSLPSYSFTNPSRAESPPKPHRVVSRAPIRESLAKNYKIGDSHRKKQRVYRYKYTLYILTLIHTTNSLYKIIISITKYKYYYYYFYFPLLFFLP